MQEIDRYTGPIMAKQGTERLAGHKDFKNEHMLAAVET